MLDFLQDLFSGADFPPPWERGDWSAGQAGLHITSDILAGSALGLLALVLAYVAVQRRSSRFVSILWLFCAFLLLGGLEYFLDAMLFWQPLHRLSIWLRLILAVLAWAALLRLLPAVAQLLALQHPHKLQQEMQRWTQELTEKEARLRAIVETAEDGILTLDEDWHILSANPVCERLFGTAVAGMIATIFTDWIVPAHSSPLSPQVGTGEGRIFGTSGEVLGRRSDGTTFPVSVALSKISLEKGRMYTVIIHDLTAFKRTEEALRRSETRLRMMLAQVPAVLCTTDVNLNVDLFTCSVATGLSQLGLRPNRFDGRSLREADDDDLAVLPRSAFERAAQGESAAAEVSWEERVFQFHVQPLREKNGKITGTIGVGLDVTRSKRIEAALRKSEAKIRAIVQAAGDGIILIKEDGTIQSVNRACKNLFGYKARELLGRNVRLLIPPAYRDTHDQALQRYLQTGEKRMIGSGREVMGLRKDGSSFPMYLSVSEVIFGTRRMFIGMVHDRTPQKEAEERLQYYAQQLQERNADLLRSNQELDDFAYIVSHDLKEPLRGIHNYSGFLIEDHADKLGEEGRSRLERMQYLCKHMEGMIDSLLHFSRVGRVQLAVQESDLGRLVQDILASLHISLQEKQVEVRIKEPLPIIRCDQVRIAEVFRNLITNAIKYSDKDHKWIEIGETTAASPEIIPLLGEQPLLPPSWIFYVRDNGIGIPAKQQQAIFGMFKRLHGRDQYGGGTGVGLTIVKRIIERHGGRIFVESLPGLGTTFYFSIPKPGRTKSGSAHARKSADAS